MPELKNGHDRTREIAIAATIIVFAIAVGFVVSSSVYKASGLQSCKNILLQKARYSCIYLYANSTMNYSACSLLPQQQASGCISSVAMLKENPDACSLIQDAGQMYNCITNVSVEAGNQSYCGMLSGNNASLCAFAVAKSGRFSAPRCGAIANRSLRLECSYISSYRRATSLSNQSYCAKLPNDTNSTLVSEIISEDYMNQSGLNAVESIDFSGLNISAREYCYLALSVKLGNAASCSNAGSFSSECASYVNASQAGNAISENITSLCATLPSYAKDLCSFSAYTSRALSNGNITSCMQIGNITYRNSCISQLAASYNDSSYCGYIQKNATLESSCNASS